MTVIRNHWHRILAVIVGPTAVLLATAAAHANDVYPG